MHAEECGGCDVSSGWAWRDWPEREKQDAHATDIGVDVVSRRKGDGVLIAIQCKSKQLDADDRCAIINKSEFNCLADSGDALWTERWLVKNGDVRPAANARAVIGQKPLKLVTMESDILKQQVAIRPEPPEHCHYCERQGDRRTKDCIRSEADETNVRILLEQAERAGGMAGGRTIPPCGTGRSRIALRIIDKPTRPGEVSAVQCISIALVVQSRRESLVNRKSPLRDLAVCSDDTAGHCSDLSKGQDCGCRPSKRYRGQGRRCDRYGRYFRWIADMAEDQDRIGVFFGTRQSSHRVAEALA